MLIYKTKYRFFLAVFYFLLITALTIYCFLDGGFKVQNLTIPLIVYIILYYEMNYLELHNTKLFIKNNFIPFKNSFIPLDEIQKVNFALANWKPNSSSKITITYKNLKIKKYSFSEAQLSEVLRLINELESLGVNVEYKKEEWI